MLNQYDDTDHLLSVKSRVDENSVVSDNKYLVSFVSPLRCRGFLVVEGVNSGRYFCRRIGVNPIGFDNQSRLASYESDAIDEMEIADITMEQLRIASKLCHVSRPISVSQGNQLLQAEAGNLKLGSLIPLSYFQLTNETFIWSKRYLEQALPIATVDEMVKELDQNLRNRARSKCVIL